MKIKSHNQLLLSDTLVPDLFITEYMSQLSVLAIQIYLYILLAEKNWHYLAEKDLSSRFYCDEDQVHNAIQELEKIGLMIWENNQTLTLVDLKAQEINTYIQNNLNSIEGLETDLKPEEINSNSPRDPLVKSIEKTFFHGSMSYKWYREVDILLDEFHFDHEVVYKLFQYAFEKGYLKSIKQMESLAFKWQKAGVINLEQLSLYLESESLFYQNLYKIGKKIKKRMNEFDEEYLHFWMDQLHFSYEIIEYALRKIAQYKEPSMGKADEYLKEWFAQHLTTLEDIKFYETAKLEKNKKAYQNKSSFPFQENAKKNYQQQNFPTVEYDEANLETFLVDPEEYLRNLEENNTTKP